VLMAFGLHFPSSFLRSGIAKNSRFVTFERLFNDAGYRI